MIKCPICNSKLIDSHDNYLYCIKGLNEEDHYSQYEGSHAYLVSFIYDIYEVEISKVKTTGAYIAICEANGEKIFYEMEIPDFKFKESKDIGIFYLNKFKNLKAFS